MTNPTPRRITGSVRFPRFSQDRKAKGLLASTSVLPEPAGPESDDALLLARAIHGAGMTAPALFALSALRPLHWLGGQAVWMLQPFIESLGLGSRGNRDRRGIGALSSGNIARLLERESGLAELAAHLDSLRSGNEPEAATEVHRDGV